LRWRGRRRRRGGGGRGRRGRWRSGRLGRCFERERQANRESREQVSKHAIHPSKRDCTGLTKWCYMGSGMTRRAKAEQASGYTVMLVDDNPDYLQATRLLLEREGHNVLTATNGPEALALLPDHRVDLLLLDYFMPGMTGEQVVAEVRKFDPFVQVILQTGYASEQPPRELLHRLNIQGYYDKTEGPDQLLLWTAVGLKAAYTLQLLFKSRRGVEFILERTPDLHRFQS